MKTTIKAETVICANKEKVWAILTDFKDYPNKGFFITDIDGDVSVGHKVIVKMRSGSSEYIFKPRILAFEKDRELRWLGSLFFKGLFDGEHSFVLEDEGENKTKLVHAESFSGILVPFFKNMIHSSTINNFRHMNHQIKELAENL